MATVNLPASGNLTLPFGALDVSTTTAALNGIAVSTN